jgi:lysophospholipase L1-like esterase
LLLRVWWRKTALEEDAATIRQIEFETAEGAPDLSPSVYAITQPEVVAVVTEHFAGNGLKEVKNEKAGHLDLASIYAGTPRATPGNDWFRRAREAHRELQLENEAELLALIARLAECSRHPFTKADAKAYIRERVDARDAEWLRFLSVHPNGRRYRAFARL